jgi:hypothetical protein
VRVQKHEVLGTVKNTNYVQARDIGMQGSSTVFSAACGVRIVVHLGLGIRSGVESSLRSAAARLHGRTSRRGEMASDSQLKSGSRFKGRKLYFLGSYTSSSRSI